MRRRTRQGKSWSPHHRSMLLVGQLSKKARRGPQLSRRMPPVRHTPLPRVQFHGAPKRLFPKTQAKTVRQQHTRRTPPSRLTLPRTSPHRQLELTQL